MTNQSWITFFDTPNGVAKRGMGGGRPDHLTSLQNKLTNSSKTEEKLGWGGGGGGGAKEIFL